jgi:Immunity protein 27
MKKLGSNEKILSGSWIEEDGAVTGDAVCRRIDHLIQTSLVEIGASPEGWEILYRDPSDGRHWELSYPHSSTHGGGAPVLKVMSFEEARQKYHNLMS